MPDHAAFEEREGSDALCAIDNLVGHDEVAGFDGFLEAADCAEGYDCADAEVPEGSDVGAGGYLMGC